ncbi:hypothetical protein OXX79_006142 [Metschnikowia pulcherrima]
MRSILKSHKRNDSDPNAALEPPPNRIPKSRTNGSPSLPSSVKLTPPMNATGFHQSSVSSPKKLLTPIKKMFGHHSKTPSTPHTTDTLQSIMNGEFEPPKNRAPFPSKRTASFPNVADMPSSGTTTKSNVLLESSSISSGTRLDSRVSSSSFEHASQQSNDHVFSSYAKTSPQSRETSKMPVITFNASDLSISSSKKSLHLSSTSAGLGQSFRHNENTACDADNGSKDSDSSSQFSFEKDYRGGRNTSVKYYKTKTETNMHEAGSPPNYFNVDDTGFEADAFSDYDFENNGIDVDGDSEDGIPRSANHYDEFLSDHEINQRRGASSPLCAKMSGDTESLSAKTPDIAFSAQAPKGQDADGAPWSLRSPEYAEDFLDTYLESRSPTRSMLLLHGESTSSSDIPDDTHTAHADGTSELGLGIAVPEGDHSDAQSVNSSRGIMDTLRKLEGNPESKWPESSNSEWTGNSNVEVSKHPQRGPSDSVKRTSLSEEAQNGSNRKSVVDMMATLSLLGQDHETNQPPADTPIGKSAKGVKKDDTKRYSWVSNEDSLGKSDNARDSGPDDGFKLALDQALLDEVNSIPENFEFNDEKSSHRGESDLSYFLRSNSYNKKPQKAVVDHDFQEMKLQLKNKTVTFYRSKSLDREKTPKYHPVRAASLKSVTSLNDENISEGDEENACDMEETSLDQRLSSVTKL